MTDRIAAETLNRCRELLRAARLGLSDLEGIEERRQLPGLFAAVVFGWAAAAALPGGDDIQAKKKALRDDSVGDFVRQARNGIMHDAGAELEITSAWMDPAAIRAAMEASRPYLPIQEHPGLWPPYSWFYKQVGGPTTSEFPEVTETRVELVALPRSYMGQAIEVRTTPEVLRIYLDAVEELIETAEIALAEVDA